MCSGLTAIAAGRLVMSPEHMTLSRQQSRAA